MRVSIQAVGLPLTATLLDYTECQLHLALRKAGGRIKKVVIRLGETNLSRRGEDKFCRVQVYVEHAAPVLIEDTGTDLCAVIERVVERAGRSVAWYVSRRHTAFSSRCELPSCSLIGAR